ncbi:cytochrome P450 [Aaosphaeria arxii CBS 175.79]|uniref:Bifunctional cytochrome P450/NADPH--P450 reductase n=1 Tax=Aaosphaeria arxii CBS 175.79 TaxID=1450172 RepID=A0A6A5XVJ7_9PLEO|nr:cytochrome P450 [Aaosphaeria arxii CBS 175.79]KAF2016963.1 cytochrome P450 [Aaosphaeria arxii CBS 175.79]
MAFDSKVRGASPAAKTADEGIAPIPEPSGLPILGNITALDAEFPLGSMKSLADQFGEIYRLRFPGRSVVLVSTQALVNETCDEKRFKKSINTALNEIRDGVHDGLFTAKMGEEAWGIAHRILMPAFGPLSIQSMFTDMHDVASQLALKWARAGPNSKIIVTDDFTRLALDTLALCSMGYRFNSYYSQELHPFIEAMGDFLTEAGEKPRRLPLPSLFYRQKDEKYKNDIETMRRTAREVLESRKSGEDDARRDLLTAMMKGVDPKTGKHMTDESIMDNLITFLIAGHETTSGLLSFVFYQLCRHPEAYQKAQREVDEAVGKRAIKVEDLNKLPYLNAVLRETLRVNATIPLFTVEAFEDTLLAGKYPVKAGETIVNLLAKSQLDPKVFGEDALEFKPERMLDEPFKKLNEDFPNCWKPFGNGMRGCIGRPFAWQESLLVMTMLLQNFNFVLEPAGYQLGFKQTLTIKPKDMHMRAILRDGLTAVGLQHRLSGQAIPEANGSKKAAESADDSSKVPLTVLYGSNSGTCESLAQRVATDAPSHGFRATKVDCLDSLKGNLPTDQAVVIITASYEGQAPDNASHFVAWLEGSKKEESPLKNVAYTVFGCGHKDWTQTYHRIPKLVDAAMADLGGERVAEIGLADVSQNQVFTDFEHWEDHVLWPSLTKKYNVAAQDKDESAVNAQVKISTPRASTLRQNVQPGLVTEAKILTKDTFDKQAKKHLEIRLPEGTTYSAGDYLVVLPINPKENVNRAMRRFQLPTDAHLEITTEGPTALPTNTSLSAYEILSSYVELQQPATKRSLHVLAASTTDEQTKSALEKLADEDFAQEINAKRVSVLDLLERFPSIDLPIGTFLTLMPPMRVRQYSISSSPLWKADHVTLTFSVLHKNALSGQGTHIGVASTYLAALEKGDTVHIAVRPSHAAFSLPSDLETTPIIGVAAGTGLSPFRAFVQERAAMIESGRKLAPAIFFYGCRSPETDDLYREEFDEWQRIGAVDVRRAYSRAAEKSEGAKYVQDRMLHDREDVAKLWRDGAKVYVCGSRAIADAAKETIIKIKVGMETADGKDDDSKGVQEWFDSLRNVRYVTDVFD